MKKNKIVSGLLVVLLVMLSFGTLAFAAGHEDIVDIAIAADDFEILVQALEAADLVDTLKGDGPFTVFAPTDEAFGNLLDDLGIEAKQLLAHPQLADVLKYHVVAGDVRASDLSDGDTPTTLEGEEITVSIEGETVKINESIVVSADVEASNGVIHIIDTVLVPSSFDPELTPSLEELSNTIVDIAVGNDDFSTLVAALTKAELVEALQAEGPFTVFAPTNAAFAKLLDGLGITADQLLDHPQLGDVLKYHVVSGDVRAGDLSDGMEPETLQGETLLINLSNGEVTINEESKVTTADVVADNGVIHIIDTVLVPEAFVLSAEEDIPEGGDIGMLPYIFVGALGVSGLVVMKKRK